MIIRIDPALRCAQVKADSPAHEMCRGIAVLAVVSPIEGNMWEMFPICSQHFLESSRSSGPTSARPVLADSRSKETEIEASDGV
jgi:hypothetical protein